MTRAVLLVSHGTVDDLDDLTAFVTNVRRGQAPGRELVAELRRRYIAIGGKSPLNEINALLARKLEREMNVPVAWANRLWKPWVHEALVHLKERGITNVALVPLAQHSAHVYAEDARRANETLGITLACATNWGRAPGLVAAYAGRIAKALQAAGDVSHGYVIMTAHSLPKAVVARGDPYDDEVRGAATAVATGVEGLLGQRVAYGVAFQSQALGADGRTVEWLGPDLPTALERARAGGARHVVFAPIGFLADHVEILYDLDVEARAMAEAHDLRYSRAQLLNADDDLVAVLADVARPLLDSA